MRTIVLGLCLTLPPTAALADKSYTSETTINHDCTKDGDVSINVSGANAVITGACAKVSINGAENKVKIASVKKLKVNGAENTVEVDAVDEISATGVGNTITYKKPVTAKKTAIKTPGVDNKISEVK
jgi:hypothetical protein